MFKYLQDSCYRARVTMAACKPKGKRKIPTVEVAAENSENAKDIKRRTRHEGDILQVEAIISQELGENPVVEYE